jgi:branched-chain amino acid transport system ATP-binding protein
MALEVNNVEVYQGDLKALWDVSLTIEDREIVVLIGSNGAGKSTLLKTICGLLRPRKGSIRFNGDSLVEKPVHHIVELGICMVPEEKRIFRGMTVLENLELGSTVRRARRAKDDTVNWVYDVFPVLKERMEQKAGTLSGGEQQMLLIGRALMSLPKLLMIDELSLGLAPLLVQTLFRTLRQIYESRGISILLVEQNVRKALGFSDRGYIIENGQIVAEGNARDFLSSKEVKEAYFGVTSTRK